MNSQVVLITGASTGIGRALAQHFHERGHRVVLNSQDPGRLERAVRELGDAQRVAAVKGDVGDAETGRRLVAVARERFGRVDTLINNAGVFAPKPFLEVEESDLDRFLGTNLKGTFFTTQAAVRAMLETGGGCVLNIGTVLVEHAIAGFPATAPMASKGGIHALTRQLAAEFGSRNIRVNTIAPGIIRSPLQGKIGVADANSLAGLHLLGRIGEPSEIAEVAYLLATHGFITGATVNVDGGHVAGHAWT